MITTHVRRTGAALALVAAVGTTAACGTVAAPKTITSASDGFCAAGKGVNVVIDFGALGGGAKKACGQGATAQAAITSAGFKLSMKPSSFGPFVCQINALPANKKCDGKPTYWGLYVSKQGKTWGYASVGVDKQPVANGDTVSFTWETSASKPTAPSVKPAAAK